jgi:hypothetical protein
MAADDGIDIKLTGKQNPRGLGPWQGSTWSSSRGGPSAP